MQCHQRLELSHRLGLAADGQHRLEAGLQRLQPKTLEACGRGLGEVRRQVGESRSTPEGERAGERRFGLVERPGPDRVRAGGDEPLELVGVDLTWRNAETVAGRLGDERAVGARLPVVEKPS